MQQKSTIWSTGLAMFSMFFGAGNIVFPLALGQFTQDKNFYGVLGMMITAVLVPLCGLMAMLLYDGDYKSFFKSIGRVPGFIVTALILGLIGPLGGIPRCITISYSTLSAFGFDEIKGVSLISFSLISCVLIYLFTFQKNKILSLLGYVLTPVLLLSLAIIAAKGIFAMPSAEHALQSRMQTFSRGLLDGYNTMDLLASFFFSSVVLLCLRKEGISDRKTTLSVAILGSLIAAVLLGLVYVAFSYLAAGYSHSLTGVESHEMLGTLAYQLLGPYAGLIAGVAVSFACLTTEIALAVVFAEFLHETLFKEKISYQMSLILTLFLSFLISTLHFTGISALLAPALQVCYPALILLTICNIFHKLYGMQFVKPIFYGALFVTLAAKFVF